MKRILTSLVLLCLAWSPVHAGQMTLLGAGVTASGGGGYTGPADAISANLLGCWSLRACSSATRGNAVANVCNTTGGIEVGCADMVTDATTGDLVSATIAAITCPGANCTIKKLYKQIGSAACTPDCSLVFNGGVQNRPALTTSCNSLGKAWCIDFQISPNSQYLTSAVSNNTIAQPLTFSAVYVQLGASGSNTGFAAITGAGSGVELAVTAVGTAQAFEYAGAASVGNKAQTVGSWHSAQGIFNGASSFINMDGSPGSTANPGANGITATSSAYQMGASAFNEAMQGQMVEMLMYSTNFSSGNNTTMCHNQFTYWGTSTSC